MTQMQPPVKDLREWTLLAAYLVLMMFTSTAHDTYSP